MSVVLQRLTAGERRKYRDYSGCTSSALVGQAYRVMADGRPVGLVRRILRGNVRDGSRLVGRYCAPVWVCEGNGFAVDCLPSATRAGAVCWLLSAFRRAG